MCRKHIFGDLKPYVCTYQDCYQPDKLYDNQHDWYTHEVQFHRREWYCKACPELFTERELFEVHLQDRHGVLPGIDAMSIVDRCERAKVTQENCVVCSLPLTSDRIKEHLGRHMVDVALITFPQAIHEEEDGTKSEEATSLGEQLRPQERGLLGDSGLGLIIKSNLERGSVSEPWPETHHEGFTSTDDLLMDNINSENGINSLSVLAEVARSKWRGPTTILKTTHNEILVDVSSSSEESLIENAGLEQGEAPSPQARSTERHISIPRRNSIDKAKRAHEKDPSFSNTVGINRYSYDGVCTYISFLPIYIEGCLSKHRLVLLRYGSIIHK